MMKLSTVQDVVSTVNEEWESPLADTILQRWEHDEGPAKYWRASANFVFFFKWSGRDYVLRFNHAEERAVEMIQAEIEHVNALAEHGINVAKPIRSLAGNYVESVHTVNGLFHAVVFDALPGKQLDLDDDELTPEQFASWGQSLGELHNASPAYPGVRRPTWEEHLNFVAETVPAEEKSALQTLGRLKEELGQLPLNKQNFGLIHYDFELDNIIWNGEQPGIIDFDDSAWYWFVADFALALRDLLGESADRIDLQNESFLHFVSGYRKSRPIDDQELKLIPLFMRMNNLVKFATLHRAVTPVNPDGELPWMAGSRAKLAAKMQFYRDEFSI